MKRSILWLVRFFAISAAAACYEAAIGREVAATRLVLVAIFLDGVRR